MNLMTLLAIDNIVARCAVIADPASGRVIGAKNAHLKQPIASLQKMLTGILIVERGNLDAHVEIAHEDTECRTVRAELRPGDTYTRRDLLACMLIGSANDAALALAREHSGSVAEFVLAMNHRAASLGMQDSFFLNPTGLPHEGQVSTALDAARLAIAASRFPSLRELFSTSEYALTRPDGKVELFRNTNKLLETLDTCDGMKTGFTKDAGHCLAVSGALNEQRRIVVVLNSSMDAVWDDGRALLESSLGDTDRSTQRRIYLSASRQVSTKAHEIPMNVPQSGQASEIELPEVDEGLFSGFDARFGEPVSRWANNNIEHRFGSVDAVFYPFGGPDFLFPFYLFPRARSYVLVGLEPCRPSPGSIDPILVSQIMQHYLEYSYFITKDLRSQLSTKLLGSVLPLLLAQIQHAGLPILGVDPADEVENGIRVTFGNEASPRQLCYFRQDLRDGHFSGECQFNRHMAGLPRFATLVKSASYLLHEPNFNELKLLINQRADLLVQDASGIPLGVLRSWGWQTQLHGNFVADLPVFSKYDQTELAQAFRDNDRFAPLPFGIGYLHKPETACLMVSVPQKPSAGL
jgi:D-alanyl-D-alanine carboxypeptidase